ncbi:nuclear RNA export factor 2-like isoform X1 [Cimex lectularius]|uniref:Nuclear RNA export factor n=1 Tax=Cimex lectularius TaxID=79782 RepID=A0A8I6RC90_CIMLE|nr:nuclear RNA export factor 2-like isoform X1 [Cimex lectularius]
MTNQAPVFIEPGDEKKLQAFIKNMPPTIGYWKRITIKDGIKYDRHDVLRLIMNAIYPHKILPVKYQRDKNDTFFIFRNTLSVLQPFCSKGLKLYNDKTDTVISIGIVIRYAQIMENDIDPSKIIEDCLKVRINTAKKVVDLRNFHNDSMLSDIYVPLSVPQCASMVCDKILTKFIQKPQALLLSYNELDRLDVLEYFRKMSHGLNCLDLSFNNITWSGFEKIPFINIRELWLEGNPLYADFVHSSTELVKEIKRVIPSILKLDGVELGRTVPGDIVNLKTCFINGAYANFVDHFLHHYFSLFENSRDLLKRIYHPEALFSITVNHIESQTTSGCQRINSYMKFNRNLISMSDIKKTYDLVHYGPNDIVNMIKTFPNVRFDPFSFQVDVPITHFGKTNMVQINVCGIFRDLDSESSALFAFDRTFLLTRWIDQEEWKIVNDMWAITNATSTMAKSSFRYAKKPVQSDFAILLNPKMKGKEQLMKIFGKLTHMNSAWVQKFLSESSWNMELALLAFTDQYKANQIPSEAFNAKEESD